MDKEPEIVDHAGKYMTILEWADEKQKLEIIGIRGGVRVRIEVIGNIEEIEDQVKQFITLALKNGKGK